VELVEELLSKRERHNAEAEKHKRSRDKLNDETKRWVMKRDELNAQARSLFESANVHRSKRDELNDQVKKAKADRDIWNRKVNELSDKLARKKKEKMPKMGPTIGQLKKQLKALEFQQMTSVLKPDKERAIIEEISKLQSEIRQKEAELEKDEDIKNLVKETSEARDKAEEHHAKVGELAEAAQREHDTMEDKYRQSEAIRKEADGAQANFIKCKVQADEEHQKHIELIKQVHDFDKMLSGLRQKEVMVDSKVEKKSVMEEAEDIYERFKKGEKLSTEDLLTLQKSGYI